MNSSQVITLVMLYLGTASAVSLPKYFKLCGRKNPEFTKCATNHAKEAIPHIVKGIRSLNIPNMKPLILPVLQLHSSENFKLNFTNLKISGLDKIVPLEVKADFAKHDIQVILHSDEILLNGTYNVDGRVLILPIQGKGPGSLKVTGGDYTYGFHYKLVDLNGFSHAEVVRDHFSSQVKNAEFKLDNLFGGDKRLGDELNKFLNQNWQDVLKEFESVIHNTIAGLCRQIARNVFLKIPFDNLFLN